MTTTHMLNIDEAGKPEAFARKLRHVLENSQ